jgi:halocyanin-like protein
MAAKHTDQRRRRDATGSPTERDRAHEEKPEPTATNRRYVLRAAGGLAALGLLAGCTGDGNDGGPNGSDDGEPNVEEWLSGTDNSETVTDVTGEETVTVEVGPSGNEYVFEPAAIRISSGTTVTWKWQGSGYHNVVASGGEFDSGNPEQKATFRHTFESTGTALYYCKPHEAMGMKGAVVVVNGNGEADADGTSNGTGS